MVDWRIPLRGLGVVVAGILMLLAGAGTDAHAELSPQISSLSESSLARSGRLLIFGSGFGGGAGSEVTIDGLPAIATTWTDTEIHAYVPETATLGSVPVQVTTPGGTSNAMTLGITTRQSDGRARWRFQMDSEYPGNFVGVGPDGTVYVTDDHNITVESRLYALTPDGGLKWVVADAGAGHPIAFGQDGTIYTGAYGINAINPDGTVRWRHQPAAARTILAGPSVGPDGNIYAADNTRFGDGLGLFCVDPDGNLLWSDRGSLAIQSSHGTNSSEIKFASLAVDRIYLGIYSDAGTPPLVWIFDYDGNEIWADGLPCIDSNPHVNLSGEMVVTGQGLCTVSTLDGNGNTLWSETSPDAGAQYIDPALGPDGTIYVAGWFSEYIWALNPDGSTRWFHDDPSFGQLLDLGVSPDNSVIVATSHADNRDLLRGFDTANGDMLWEYEFPPEGARHVANSYRPAFSADSRTAYVTTLLLNYPGYSYLYAFSLEDQSTTAVALETSPAASFMLRAHPSPFRASTSASFDLPHAAPVKLTIHDVAGRLVKTILHRDLAAGTHTFDWSGQDDNGAQVARGIYFMQIESESLRQTAKVVRR